MRKFVFATNNSHKLKELKEILGNKFEILSLNDIGCTDEIPETGITLEENAAQKSYYIWERFRINCFADDTGLEIKELNNEPGVYSARYAGDDKNAGANMQKVLNKMDGVKNREARFRTVISLIIDGKEKQFEGIVDGVIIEEKRGAEGFGYDPIFMPQGFNQSFAEMPAAIKNQISHRGNAVKKLVYYLLDHGDVGL
jgi:XTP/dITP diphosphohydrolase